ncbi:hypothetical protein K435DRAFT_811205 [Dendrothele bispora CBS 962.96]|uniref:Uncharacterized protein n=1 Tax=Dendrothele bispora (strain CBS 962.96) TaxID=1314807 RepID=A0A4S8KSZ0_DENBC|nr:hypothetical protein K435DRAFT_811205 [Dendrothele bispora CBS 962.96]
MPFPNLSTIKRYSSLREPDFPADKRKTHSNPQACEAMKALPVERRLAVNKRIDDRNLENRERRYLVASGALTLDEDEVISDTASHWTIEDQEYETIKNNPEIFERVKDLLPNRWFRCIVETRAKEKIEKENNKGRDLMLARDMNEVPRDLSTFLDLKFPPELFIAANFAYIPLGLFKSKHVRVLQTTAAGTTPKTVYEEGKKTKIWDIAAISKNLDIKSDDFEGCPTFVEFLEAMENYIRFVVDWDRDKEEGKYAQFIYSHGLFFKNPENADLYPYWKGTEKELREDRRTQGFKFDLPTYRDKMQTCRSERSRQINGHLQ